MLHLRLTDLCINRHHQETHVGTTYIHVKEEIHVQIVVILLSMYLFLFPHYINNFRITNLFTDLLPAYIAMDVKLAVLYLIQET